MLQRHVADDRGGGRLQTGFKFGWNGGGVVQSE